MDGDEIGNVNMLVEIQKRHFTHIPALFFPPPELINIKKAGCGHCGGQVGELLSMRFKTR